MATVQRANVILQIEDDDDIIQKYRDKGFDVIDNATGKVIERAVPHDVEAFTVLVKDLKAELQQKNREIEKLKAELAKVEEKKTNSTSKKATSGSKAKK